MIAAIIPTAGPSTRMGCFKPLLEIGAKSMVRQVIAGLTHAGIEDILIVAGYRQEAIVEELAGTNVHIAINEFFINGLSTSIATGIAHLDPHCNAFFIWPADIPIVRPYTLQRLMQAHTRSPSAITRPTYMGEYGYPLLIPFQSAEYIQSWQKDDGFQHFIDQSSIPICNVPVADRHILLDVNTPEDYRQALACWSRKDVPTAAECEEILTAVVPVEERVLRHGRKVAEVACRIGTALVETGLTVDLEALMAGGLLHDIAKGCKDHALAGQQMLIEMGYPRIGEIVGSHTDLQDDETSEITEAEVVHIADKLVAQEDIIGIEKRFEPPLRKWARDPVAMDHIERRRAVAVKLQKKIEAALCHPLQVLFHS